jgi:PAS domain S-box-containing protein
VVLAAGIVAIGSLHYQNQKRHYRTKVEHELSAIADLKTDGIAQWRQERLADAGIFFNNTAFSVLVRRFFDHPEDAEAQKQIQEWAVKLMETDQYDLVRLLDAQGVTRLSSPAGAPPVSSVVLQRIPEILRSGQVTFQDFHRNEHDQRVYLDILIPFFDEQDASRPLGVFYLRIDPDKYLYPLIQRWPVPSKTAETLLVRRDGNDVLFLNELKFQTNTALNLRISLENTNVASVKAVLGQKGVVEGRDYRGEQVLAALRAIPDSPWFLVARMDVAEVFAPQREQLWLTVLLMSALLIGAGAGVGAIWRQQRVQFYKERYRAEEARAKLAAIVESSDDAIISKNLDGTITSWNASAEHLFGYRAGEIIGQPITRIIPADRHAQEAEILERLRRGERVEHFETVRIAKDGRPIDVSLSISPIRDAGGTIIGASKIVRDITERKRAEAALRESEEKYRGLFESSRDSIMTMEPPSWKFTSGNPAAVKMFGVKNEEEFVSLGPWELSPERQPDGRASAEKSREMTEIALREGSHFFEWTHRRIGGEEFPVNVLLTKMVRDGKVEIQATVRDITGQKRLQQELLQSQKTEAIGRLAGGIAHEFNSLLTAILGYSNLALTRLPSDSPLRHHLEQIESAGNRAAALTSQFLAFSRKYPQELKSVNLNTIVLEMQQILQPMLGPAIHLTTALDSALGIVIADPTQMEQIIMSMAVNARDAMPHGGELTIATANVHPDDDLARRHPEAAPRLYIRLMMSDTGVGMSDDVKAKLFDPFFTTKATGQGTGLELAACFGMIKQTGGFIDVESAPGKGTTFQVFLPQADAATAATQPHNQ